MCGILGSNFKSSEFKKAIELINHRGPDYQGYIEHNEKQFGHTRLSIIDLQKESNQPMVFDDLILTFNGEIYNYQELIKKENLECITKSDSEVIIRLYQKYNMAFLNKLNGMFSFCIYDKNNDTFFCARDKFGKKPFYYYYRNNKFIYSSEIKSILKILNFTPTLNKNSFYEYLSFSTPINDTFYENIHKLKAGEYLLLKKNQLTINKYYDIDNIETTESNEEKIIHNIEELLLSSVEKRLTSDVEVATLLSGGVDSSLISALYSKISNKKINTFCIGYDEYTQYSELPYAKIVSEHISSNHHEVIMTKNKFLETTDIMLEHTDEPFGDSAAIPTYILSEYINKQGIKVALSGEGSDENFLGYDNYFKMLNYYSLQTKNLREFDLTKEWEYEYRSFKNEPIHYSSGEAFTEKHKQQLLKNYTEKKYIKNLTNYSPTKWLSYIDFKIWIAEVLMTKLDRMSMANSLELRAPFLDYRLVEYLLSVDGKIKRGNTNKYLLKKIAEKYLPKEIVHRRKKGFSSPFIEWTINEYKDETLNLIFKVNNELNIFNKEFIIFLYNEAKHNRFKQHFWNLYIFAKWFDKVYL